ncbi:Hypothetical protein ETEE_0483 [Edwardsiella anguillarum ET080813]|uniref:Uncharacterized protein n=1 Tax=Edwardsiella anguillarum ET080813 TaxID=667120 RepID=A0A076LFQ3_9GAMM|nr:Hypothetical protein ETEE_0483 [Edwardsiella anguillarum ET080813]
MMIWLKKQDIYAYFTSPAFFTLAPGERNYASRQNRVISTVCGVFSPIFTQQGNNLTTKITN